MTPSLPPRPFPRCPPEMLALSLTPPPARPPQPKSVPCPGFPDTVGALPGQDRRMPDGTWPRPGSLRPGSGEWSPDAWEAGGTWGPGLSAQRRRAAALPAGLSGQSTGRSPSAGLSAAPPRPSHLRCDSGHPEGLGGSRSFWGGALCLGLGEAVDSLFEEALQTFPGFLRWLPEARSDRSAGQLTVPHSSAHRSSWSIHALLAPSRPLC